MSIKVLFLAPDPSDAARLRLGEELREIQTKLTDKGKFELKDRWAVRPQDVHQAILDIKPQIVHFSGHGTESGELCLEDNNGQIKPVRPDVLASLFQLAAEHVKCVVINTCYSEEQAKAIAEYIPFVIGMKEAIGDKASIEFATGFYASLGADQSITKIENAFHHGCIAIKFSAAIEEHQSPVLVFGDHKNKFRSEVASISSCLESGNSISISIYRQGLLEEARRRDIPEAEAETIIDDIFNKKKEVTYRSERYRQCFIEAIENELPIEESTRAALKYLQAKLELANQVIEQIEKDIINMPKWHTAEAYFKRGLNRSYSDEHERSIKYFTDSIKLRSNFSAAYLERGLVYYNIENLEKSIEDYSQAIEKNAHWNGRNIWEALFQRAYTYYDIGKRENPEKLKDAIDDLSQAIKHKPRYSRAYYNRALIHSYIGNHDDAISDFNKSIETNNDWGTITPIHAHYNLILKYRDLGETSKSKKEEEKIQEFINSQTDILNYIQDNPDIVIFLDYLGIKYRPTNS